MFLLASGPDSQPAEPLPHSVSSALYRDCGPPVGLVRSSGEVVHVDCCDRFALWLAELTLDRVKGLSASVAPAEMTVRASCQRRRFDVTIYKDHNARYRWTVREVTPGMQTASALSLQSGEAIHCDPEEAYWSAWGAIDRTVRGAA